MKIINTEELNEFVNKNIEKFHNTRLNCLQELKLPKLLSKNPYLFKAKNLNVAGEFIENLLNAFLSSSEEKIFGDFLESLAIYVSERTSGGFKSGISGIDLEILRDEMHYLISIKSGSNWGNAAQHTRLSQDFSNAITRIRQIDKKNHPQAVLGICYGKVKTSYLHSYCKLVGQNFWFFISGNDELYKEIIEPIGFRAKEHNEKFEEGKAQIINKFTNMFIEDFCTESGKIDWEKLVEFNSRNLDLESLKL